MADEKNMPMPGGEGVDVPTQESSIDEKLKAAAGNIDRHHADSKQRESELARENKEKRKEELQRIKDAEQRSIDLHREAVLNAAAEQEAFEEQRKLRKKLERERRRKMEEERRLLAEEKKAREENRAREVAEALEKEKADTEARKAKSAELLSKLNTPEPEPEAEQPEVPDTEVMESVPTPEEPLAEEPKAEEPVVEEPAAEEPVVEEPVVEEPVVEESMAEEPVVEEPVAEEPEAVKSEVEEIPAEEPAFEEYELEEYDGEVTKADLDVSVGGGEGEYFVHLRDGQEDENGDFVIEIDDDAQIVPGEPAKAQKAITVQQTSKPRPVKKVEKKPEEPAPEEPGERIVPKVKTGKLKVGEAAQELDEAAPTAEGRKPSNRIRLTSPNLAEVDPFEDIEEEPEEEVIERIPITIYDIDEESGKIVIDKPKDEQIPPLTFDDDLITSIKKQGKAVNDKNSYKQYIKRSEKAISDFYSDINRIDKNIEDVEDENRIPPMIVESITIMGKIVDIRCDNLSVTARTQKSKVVDKYREILSSDIDNYNSRVAYFTKVTGSKLTKLSAFLPNAIAEGTGRAIIPQLSYVENYVEIFPDADGNLPEEDDNISTIVISPIVSFEEEIGNASPKNREEAKDFIDRVNKSKKKLLAKINGAAKSIEKNAAAKRKNLEKEESAFTAREQDVTECYQSFSRKERRGRKFARILKAIDDRYRSVIVEAREERREKRYDDTDKCLHVERLTAERERVVFTLEAIRSLRGIITPKELKAIMASAVREMQTYNSLAKECGSRVGKELSSVSGALADEVMRTGEKYLFPLIVKRRELYERVGKTERLVGDRVKSDYLKTTKAERLKSIRKKFNFDADKSVSDGALMREDVRLRAIEKLAGSVRDGRTFKRLIHRCKYAFKEFKRTLKQTDKAIFRARDRDGVIVAITENLRVRGKYIAAIAVVLECAVDNSRKKYIKKYELLLENQVERYNDRCADYRNITRSKANDGKGWRLTQISALLPENLVKAESTAMIPELSYRERYIECYPMVKESDNVYTDPAKRGCEYRPIDYNDRRYTENDMVEVTVINSPISAVEQMRIDKKAKGRIDSFAATASAFFIIYGVRGLNYYLKRAKRHKNRALRQEKRFDKKLDQLITSYEKKTRKLNDKTPELLRESQGYVKKMRKIELEYNKKSVKLRYRRAKKGIERRILNYSVRELAIYREVVAAQMLTLKRVRTSATKSSIGGVKRDLVLAIREHNDIADALSLILGKPIARISTTVADEIIREGAEYKLPKLALCKETIESVGDGCRTIGDPYRHGMPYTINSQGIAVITGTCRVAPGVGIKGIGLDADLKPIIGATTSGLTYAGVPDSKVLGIALNENVATSATRAGRNSPVYGIATEFLEPEDALFSDIDMKPVSEEIREINNYLVGAISTRAGAVSSVFDYRHYTRRTRLVRWKVQRIFRTTNRRFKKYDKLLNEIFRGTHVDDRREITHVKPGEESMGNLTEQFRTRLAREGIGRLLEKAGKSALTISKDELHSFVKKKDLLKRRARVFSTFAEVRYLEQCHFAFELRTLAALGKLIEIRCADLCAASKLQLTVPMQIKLWLLWLGFNPRKKCRKKLNEEIERYNNVHVARAEDVLGREDMYDLSLINTMLPEGLANREYLPDIPYLVYRDRFAEVVTTSVSRADAKVADKELDEINYVKRTADTSAGRKNTVIAGTYIKQTERSDDEGDDEVEGKEPEVNLINSSIIPIATHVRRDTGFFKAEDYFYKTIGALEESRKKGIPKQSPIDNPVLSKKEFEKKVRDLIKNRFDKMTDKLDRLTDEKLDLAEYYAGRNEKFVKKKLFALHRYEKAVFRISRITHETARYQRKMSRRLKMFRKRLYWLRMREIRFSIVGGRIKDGADVYDMRVPSMSYEELRRRSAVEAMLLERRRLILAVYLCRAVHGANANDNEFRRKSVWLSKARRAVTKAMIHYTNTTGECERVLKTKKLWIPDMSWYKQVQSGDFDKAISDIPRLVSLRQLAELYDEIKPIDQRVTTTIISPRA